MLIWASFRKEQSRWNIKPLQEMNIAMSTLKNFTALSNEYRTYKRVAIRNLTTIAQDKTMRGIVKLIIGCKLASKMKPFDLEKLHDLLSYQKDGKRISLILGDFNENAAFYPSITEKILNLHGQMNYVNGAFKNITSETANSVIPILQRILLDCLFLDNVFKFCADKSAVIQEPSENLEKQREKIKQGLEKIISTFHKDLKNAAMFMDRSQMNESLKQYSFKSSWIEYDVTNEGKMVNDYYLPKEYADPYLLHLARQQMR